APTSLVLLTSLLLGAAPPAEEPDTFRADPAWRPLGRSLWFDPREKRLVVRARVVLREGPLEHLLCLKGTKEHQAILPTDATPAFLLPGPAPGHPSGSLPKSAPQTASPIAIELQWDDRGKTRTADARRWIRDEKKKAPLTTDWVFAGSELLQDPITKKPVYTA